MKKNLLAKRMVLRFFPFENYSTSYVAYKVSESIIVGTQIMSTWRNSKFYIKKCYSVTRLKKMFYIDNLYIFTF